MRKIIVTVFLSILIVSFTSIAYAEIYKLNITRIDQDLYKDTYTNYYIKTRSCYEYCYYQDVIFNSETNQLIFPNGFSYDITGVLK